MVRKVFFLNKVNIVIFLLLSALPFFICFFLGPKILAAKIGQIGIGNIENEKYQDISGIEYTNPARMCLQETVF